MLFCLVSRVLVMLIRWSVVCILCWVSLVCLFDEVLLMLCCVPNDGVFSVSMVCLVSVYSVVVSRVSLCV